MERTHWGQHDDCYGCKLATLSFDPGGPKQHIRNGNDPWTGNPVKERIEELTGVAIDTDHLLRNRPPGAPTTKEPNAYL